MYGNRVAVRDVLPRMSYCRGSEDAGCLRSLPRKGPRTVAADIRPEFPGSSAVAGLP